MNKKERWMQKVELAKPGARKKLITLRLDPDVLDWFRDQGGYGPRINAVLRAYMMAHQEKTR